MKHIILVVITLIIISCSTTQLVKNWKNPDIGTYEANKVLVVGMTPNIEARKQFEIQLKKEYDLRGIEAVMSLDLFEPTFSTEQKSEAQLKRIEDILIANGFDTVLFTKIIGIEDKVAYNKNYEGYDETYRKFKEEYLMHQDIYYNPDYYENYKVYHAETSIYCICPTKDRELIWKGYIDITDPNSIDETVNDYVKLLIVVLENQSLIKTIDSI